MNKKIKSITLIAIFVFVTGLAGVKGANATIDLVPTSSTYVGNCIPFGNNTSYGFTGFIYRNVPAFELRPGNKFAFDLGRQNDMDIRRNIYFAVANTNPVSGTHTQNIRAMSWTQVVSDSQHPLNPTGNSVVGDYELTYTSEGSFSFPGGGLIVGFRGSPPGGYPDTSCDQVLVGARESDASGFFYARFYYQPDLSLGVLDSGSHGHTSIGGIVIDDCKPALLGTTVVPRFGGSGSSNLVEIDPTTGLTIRTIGSVGYIVNGMEYDRTTGKLYGSTSSRDSNHNGLIEIDINTGAGTPIGSGWASSITNITVNSSGQMYGWWDPGQDDLVSIDKNAGTFARVGESNVGTAANGLDFDNTDILYMVNTGGSNYTVNISSGAATLLNHIGTTAHHGDFNPNDDYYYGISGRGGAASSLVVADLSTGTVINSFTALDDSIHTITFIGCSSAPTNNPPEAVCANRNVSADTSCTADADVNNGSTDPDGDPITVSYDPPGPYGLGNTLVTLTVEDDSGETDSCTATVTVVDDQGPTISCRSNITVSNDPGICGARVTYASPSVADNCSTSLVQTAGLASGTIFPIGTTTNTFVVTDAGSNTASCSFTVTVNDTENPEISCSDISVNNDAGVCGATVIFGPAGTDNCPGATTVQTAGPTSGSTFPIGDTTVTFVVTDASGNTASCSFTVTVNDTENPEISCSDISVNNDPGECGAVVSFDPVGTDNCPGASTVQTVGPVSGSTFPVGDTLVTFMVTDAATNTASCSFTVTVTDNEPPTATATDITVELDSSGNRSITAEQVHVSSSDNCGIDTLSVSQTDFDCSYVGINTVTLTVTDVNGNDSTVDADVTVLDITLPTIACPANISVNNDPDTCGAIVSYIAPSGSDSCSGVITAVPADSNLGSGSLFPIGTTIETFTVTDDSENSASCSFTVTVSDNEPPTATATATDITVELDSSGNGSITAEQVDDGSSDNCGIETLSVSQTDFDCSHVGINTVTLTVTDVNGNVSTVDADVTVEDNIDPTAISQDVTVQLDAAGNGSTTAALVDNGSNDACGIDTLIVSQTDFDCSHVGINTVTLTVTDVNGNVSTVDADVTVEDNVDPIAISQDVTVQLDATGNGSTTAALVDNGSNDACGIASLTLDKTSFDCSNVGIPNPVILTVTDVNGNSSTATANVTVEDDICPTVEVKLEPIEGMLKKNKGCFTVVITPEDNCSIADVVADLNGHPVANGQIVELKKKKKYKVKLKKEGSHDDDSSGDDDDSSRGRRRCKPDVKFEGPDFTLTATVTDSSGNGGGLGECNKGLDTDNGSDTDRDVYVFPSKHDGHSHDRHNHDGDSKSNDDDNSGKRNK